jgi:hypothetical protein
LVQGHGGGEMSDASLDASGDYTGGYLTYQNMSNITLAGGTAAIFLYSTNGRPPTVAIPASANPNPVTGNSTVLSVLGADSGGESSLTYTWTETAGPAAASFTANGTNAAQNTTVTFSQAGTYTFQATITDTSGLSVASSVNVTVDQTLSSIVVTPGPVTLNDGGTQQFAATGLDQFGQALSMQPTLIWTVGSGGIGTINSSGVYSAPISGTGSATVQASGGMISGSATVTVQTAQPPTVVTPASASPTSVTGTTTKLSVVGADAAGEASLTYTWSSTGPAAVTFSSNSTNAAQDVTATFTKAGTYTFTATIIDPAGLSTTSSVTVTVAQKLTRIVVSPATVALAINEKQQFAATALDQFGIALAAQPTLTWSKPSGVGTISSTGLYTASVAKGGSATVRASAGGLNGTATVTVNFTAPTAPSNLAASIVSGMVALVWRDTSPSAAGFHVQRSTNGTSWTTLANASASQTSYTTALPKAGTTYYYRIVAYNAAGTSAASNVVSVTHGGMISDIERILSGEI